MSEWIGEYKRLTPMRTAGSGSARWCIASRGLDRFFVKEFLSPVFPAQEDTELGRRQAERCEVFEGQKHRLYEAISCVIGDTLVPVIDFFRFERRYYAISELVTESHITAEDVSHLSDEEKRRLLLELALCLQRLHTQGIVHADLKPDHVLLLKMPSGYQVKLIDLDSGFLADDPPQHERDMEGDPVYLAPEAFLRMIGEQAPIGSKLDTFAFGAVIHHIWTGELPVFDHSRYHYLYEAALDGGAIRLSEKLPQEYHRTVRRMFSASPEDRPSDARITALFDERGSQSPQEPQRVNNGLSRLMKRGSL